VAEVTLTRDDFREVRGTKADAEDVIEIPVQVLGKLRGRIKVSPQATADEMRAAAEADADVAKFLEGKTIVKVIAVPKRMVNFVVK
jgi:leucyl-tRNA synthetase